VAVLGDGRVVAAVPVDGDALAADGDASVLAGALDVCTVGAPHAPSTATTSNAKTNRCANRNIHSPYTCSIRCLVSLKRKDTLSVKCCQDRNVTFVAFYTHIANDNDYQYFTFWC
jgi:hypothetical protein